jgi:glutathione S-transferase
MRARMALYLSKTVVELREVSLRDKPQSMLEISPKGTVPVLILDDGSVIDESIEIIEWCIKKKKNIFTETLNNDQELFTEDAIKLFDEKFKFHLDRYKYATRYEDIDEILHRESCVEILKTMENKISNKIFFYTDHLNKIDICILPFIRQFRIANPEWFDNHIEFPKVQKWLDNFLKSSILEEIMVSHEVWKKNNPAIFFPTNL